MHALLHSRFRLYSLEVIPAPTPKQLESDYGEWVQEHPQSWHPTPAVYPFSKESC